MNATSNGVSKTLFWIVAAVVFLIELLLLWQVNQLTKYTQKLDGWLRSTMQVCEVVAPNTIQCKKLGDAIGGAEGIQPPPKCSWGKCQ